MTLAQFNAFCRALPHTTHVVQWGGGNVWKVGGKVFAVMWDGADKNAGVTFKASPTSFELLRDQPGLRPAPYLASRGMTWIQRFSDEGMSDAELKAYLKQSYCLVFESLPKAKKAALPPLSD